MDCAGITVGLLPRRTTSSRTSYQPLQSWGTLSESAPAASRSYTIPTTRILLPAPASPGTYLEPARQWFAAVTESSLRLSLRICSWGTCLIRPFMLRDRHITILDQTQSDRHC